MYKALFLYFCLLAAPLAALEPPALAAPSGIEALAALFLDQKDGFFLREAEAYLKQNPNSSVRPELEWMRGQALLRLKKSSQAKTVFYELTNQQNAEVRHRALFDLADIAAAEGNTTLAQDYLSRITADAPTRVHEAAASRLMLIRFARGTAGNFQKDLSSFAALYPESQILGELYYFAALSELNAGNIKGAESYGRKVEGRKGDTFQRLLAEIALQKKDYDSALGYFLPLAQKEGVFQDEALYKCGLIYKMRALHPEAAGSFRRVVDYFPNSPYYTRAQSELAAVNILLKNYDAALAFYRRESGFGGGRKAEALLKITEIYFIKGDSRSTVRAAERVQRDFPYSAYANEALYWLARNALNDKQFAKSIDIFSTYMIREPLSGKKDEILVFLGQAYDNLGDHAEARRRFQTVVRESKDTEAVQYALLGLARSYTRENQPARALEFYDKVWQTDAYRPSSKEQALYFSGASRYNLRQNKEAAENLRRLTKDYPKGRFTSEARLLLAKLNFKNEDFSAVLAQDSEGFASKETLSQFRELQGRSEFRLERYESALTNFREARALNSDKQRASSLILAEAGALRNLGRRKEALRLYEQYMAEDESGIEDLLWNEIILTYIEAGELENASRKLEEFSLLSPRSEYRSGLYFKLADEYFAKKRFTDSAALYKAARSSTAKKDQIAEAALREGWSLDNASRYPEAAQAFQIFLSQGGGFATGEVLGKLAEYKDRGGDSGEARRLREEILKKYPSSLDAEKARIALADALPLSADESVFTAEITKTKDKAYQAKLYYRLALKFESENNMGRYLGTLWQVHSMKDPVLGGEAALRMAQATLKEGDARGALNLFITVITDYQSNTDEALLGIVESYLALGDIKNAARFAERLENQFSGSSFAKRARVLVRSAAPQGSLQ